MFSKFLINQAQKILKYYLSRKQISYLGVSAVIILKI